MSLPICVNQDSPVSNSGLSSEKPNKGPRAISFGLKVKLVGRVVFNDLCIGTEKVHGVLCQPFGLVGAALGAGGAFVGGAVYKAGMHALGRADQTRPLSDYAVEAANKSLNATCKLAGVVLAPVVGTLALGVSAAGVTGAALGATITVVGTPVYNMVKRHKGEHAQVKNISDYVITGAQIGAYAGMFVGVGAAYFASMFLIPHAKLVLAGTAIILGLSSHYLTSEPSWIEKKDKVV